MKYFKTIANREKAPMYKVGKCRMMKNVHIKSKTNGIHSNKSIIIRFFGSSPKTIMRDDTINKVIPRTNRTVNYLQYLKQRIKLRISCM